MSHDGDGPDTQKVCILAGNRSHPALALEASPTSYQLTQNTYRNFCLRSFTYACCSTSHASISRRSVLLCPPFGFDPACWTESSLACMWECSVGVEYMLLYRMYAVVNIPGRFSSLGCRTRYESVCFDRWRKWQGRGLATALNIVYSRGTAFYWIHVCTRYLAGLDPIERGQQFAVCLTSAIELKPTV